MKRPWICALTCAIVLLPVAAQRAAAQVNVVVQWNKNLLAIVRTPGAQPATVHSTRSFAMMHAAIYDAVNSIDGTHQPYLFHTSGAGASEEAAAAQAAHDVLSSLYPSFQATLDSELAQSLAAIPDGTAKQQGETIGSGAATAIIGARNGDGSQVTPPPFVFGTGPGQFQSTPPNFPKAQFTIWSHVTPFALNSAGQFRPGPPPSLASNQYTADFNQVSSVGQLQGTAATATQKIIARFWNGAIQDYWNEIAQTAAIGNSLTTAQNARLFALLDLTLADTVIAFYDAKYTYLFWRPVTAIQEAGTDNNPSTAPNANWLPEGGPNTPPDPSYPGAHASISSAAAGVLDSVLGTDQFSFAVTSEVLAGVARDFTSFSAAHQEASISRVYAGVHFPTDENVGDVLGGGVAGFVVNNFLLPVGAH